jgi:hypothetical protein
MNLRRKINSLWTVIVNNRQAKHFTTRDEARTAMRDLKAGGLTNVYIAQRNVGGAVRRR